MLGGFRISQAPNAIMRSSDAAQLATNERRQIFRQIGILQGLLKPISGAVFSRFYARQDCGVASTKFRFEIDPGAADAGRGSARAIRIGFPEMNDLLLEFSCKACTSETLLIEELAQIRIRHVIGSVAISILSVAAGIHEFLQEFDCL